MVKEVVVGGGGGSGGAAAQASCEALAPAPSHITSQTCGPWENDVGRCRQFWSGFILRSQAASELLMAGTVEEDAMELASGRRDVGSVDEGCVARGERQLFGVRRSVQMTLA